MALIPSDAFYKVLNEHEKHLAMLNSYDFDSPEAIDFDLLGFIRPIRL